MNDLISHYILLSLSAFLISVVITPIIRKICQKRYLLDFPTIPRKVHTVPLPRLGGIAIYAAFFLPLFAIFLTEGLVYRLLALHVNTLLSLWAASTLVFVIGVYDDIRGATVIQKLLVQIIAAILIYFLGFKIQFMAMPFVGSVSLGILSFPVTILWIIGVTNAINFIDGIDGLACGVGFFSVSTMFILSLFLHNPLTAFFAASLAGGLLGFAVYNFAPASIFMGDSGSLFIGFIIAAISLQGAQKSSTAVVLLIPIVALGVPIADTLLAIIRRVGNGISPFTADKEHIHHKLLGMGFSSRQVALVLYVVCSLLGITALLMTAVNNQMLALILIVLSAMTIGGMKMLGYTADFIEINALAKKRIQEKKRLSRQQKIADDILADIQAAPDIATLKKMIIRYFEIMELDIGKFFVPRPLIETQHALVQNYEKTHPTGESQDLQITWYSLRYEEQRISVEHIWEMNIPLILNSKKYGEFHVGKYLDTSASLLEIPMIIHNLKYAVEQKLLSMNWIAFLQT